MSTKINAQIRNAVMLEHRKRRTKNPAYSLRAFARDLGVSPSYLSEFLKGKSTLSLGMSRRIAERIGWDLGRLETDEILNHWLMPLVGEACEKVWASSVDAESERAGEQAQVHEALLGPLSAEQVHLVRERIEELVALAASGSGGKDHDLHYLGVHFYPVILRGEDKRRD